MQLSLSKVDSQEPCVSTLAMQIVGRNRSLIAELQLEIKSGGVILHGFAYTYFGKQIAQEEVMQWGLLPIIANKIIVSTGDPSDTAWIGGWQFPDSKR
jgi:hypothetical protein